MKLTTVLIIGLLLGISVAIIPRRDQSCQDNVYESWYYNGQQCMQCYNYDARDTGKLCFNCNTDGTCSTDCAGGYSSATETLYISTEGKLITKEVADELTGDDFEEIQHTYCRRCNINEGEQGLNCCFMDQKNRFGDSDGVKRSGDNGVHITQCLSIGDFYLSEAGQKSKYAKKGVTIRYGSMCQYLANCAESGDYGHCKKCMSGYYLDDNLQCVGCSNKVWQDTDEFLNGFDISMDQYTSDGVTSENGCEICEGKFTCRKCKPGFYLASNYLREHFDRNIAKHASYCVKCADNCICDESSNLCTGCKETEGYYYNPKTMQCQQCKYESDGTTERKDMKECKRCEWRDEIEDVICIECNLRSSDDVTNVIDLNVPYTYKDSQGNIQIEKTKKKICMNCKEAMEKARQVDVTLIREENSSNRYQIQEEEITTFQNEELDNRKFEDILFISPFDEHLNISEGCSECQKLQANAQQKVDENFVDIDDSEQRIYFLTCGSCNNGFAEYTIPGGYKVKGQFNSQPRYWEMKELTTCQRCQNLIDDFDKNVSFEETYDNTENTGETDKFDDIQGNREKLVRRCKRTGQNAYFNQYEITQCGSYDSDSNYLKSDSDKADRGLYYFKDYANKEKEGGYNAMTLAGKIDVAKYWNFDKQFGWFRVDIRTDSDVYSNKIKNVCVKNENKCRRVKDITTFVGDFVLTDENSSPLDSPRCEECFPGYIKTRSSMCKRCLEQQNDLPRGCIECQADEADGQEDEIVCIRCRNKVQCGSQGPKTGATTSQARVSDKSSYTELNYYFDQQDCHRCEPGCYECLGTNGECEQAQDFWRLVPGTSPVEFEPCEKDYCIQCDQKKETCEQCQSGYVLIDFKVQVDGVETIDKYCEKCGEGCADCDADTTNAPFNRTICRSCQDGYFLNEDGRCTTKRANCIYWSAQGGECLQCEQGYRLTQGFCYKCLDYEGGFIDCPSQCDSETKMYSNVRTAAQIKIDEELFKKKYPSEPTQRILELLDEI